VGLFIVEFGYNVVATNQGGEIVAKTYEEINEKIRKGEAVVVTADEMTELVKSEGAGGAARKVDVVTTGTFGPMCSSGAFINFGHSEPPIKMTNVWLNDVPVCADLAAVDVYVGATAMSDTEGMAYGGAHVIQDLIEGKDVVPHDQNPPPVAQAGISLGGHAHYCLVIGNQTNGFGINVSVGPSNTVEHNRDDG